MPKPLFLVSQPYRFNRVDTSLPTEQIKVCLVNLIAGGKFAEKTQPATGIAVLAGYLRATTRAQVSIVDMQGHLDDLKGDDKLGKEQRFEAARLRTLEEIKRHSPHIVGFSMKWGTLGPAESIIQTLRTDPQFEESLFLVGNTLSTFGSKELLGRPAFRKVVAVLGEGEEALKRIVERASQNLSSYYNPALYRGIPNVKTESVDDKSIRIENLDLERYPLFTEMNAPEIFGDGFGSGLEASRGCSWTRCTFCSISELYENPFWRPFPAALVLDRIERHLRLRHFPGVLGFLDLDFLGIRKKMERGVFYSRVRRAQELAAGLQALSGHYAEALGEKPFSEIWLPVRADAVYAQGEPYRNRVRRRLLGSLKDAGFTHAQMGIESASPAQLRRYGKGVSVDENRRALSILRGLGIYRLPGLIIFDPEVSEEELLEDMDFVCDDGISIRHTVSLGDLRPQAGAPIVKALERGGFLGDFDLDQLSYTVNWENTKIGHIHQIFTRWSGQTGNLVTYLDHAKVNPPHWLFKIRSFNARFLKAYLEQSESRRKKVLEGYLTKMEELLLEFQAAITRGEVVDPGNRLVKEMLPEAMAKNEAWFSELSEPQE